MRNQEWDATLAKLYSLDLAQLVLRLFSGNAVDGEATLGVVDKTEVLASLLDADYVHVAGWVGRVGANLAVDLDKTLHDNGLGLAGVERILQSVIKPLVPIAKACGIESCAPVADEHNQRHAVSELVRTGGGLWCVGSGQLVQEPVAWCRQTVLVLSWSTSHVCDLVVIELKVEEKARSCSRCRKVRSRMCERGNARQAHFSKSYRELGKIDSPRADHGQRRVLSKESRGFFKGPTWRVLIEKS